MATAPQFAIVGDGGVWTSGDGGVTFEYHRDEEAVAKRLEKYREAEARARELLDKYLSVEQCLQLDKHGYFDVIFDGYPFYSAVSYRIYHSADMNVRAVNPSGREYLAFCLQAVDSCVPLSDRVLSQFLMLKHEPGKFFETANAFRIYENGRMSPLAIQHQDREQHQGREQQWDTEWQFPEPPTYTDCPLCSAMTFAAIEGQTQDAEQSTVSIDRGPFPGGPPQYNSYGDWARAHPLRSQREN